MMSYFKKECVYFSALGFALVAGPVLAQEQVITSSGDKIVAQPVAVNSAMSPRSVPQALPEKTYAETIAVSTQGTGLVDTGSSGLEVEGAETGIGGSNPGNANTGGVQVQNVTVQASPTTEVTTDSLNRAGLMRAERKRQELSNEDRLLEKIEKGRLEDERERAKHIEGFESSLGNNSIGSSTAVAPGPVVIGSGTANSAVATGENATAIAIAEDSDVVKTSVRVDDDFDTTSFRITPLVGYKWIADDTTPYFDIENIWVGGLGFEGVFNRYLSFEANFVYSRDEMQEAYGYGPAGCGPSYGACGPAPGMVPGGYAPGYVVDVRSRDNYELTGGVKFGTRFGRVRPFTGVSFGAVLSKYNIDNDFTVSEATLNGYQRSTNHFLANFGGGLEFNISRTFSLGGRLDYQMVLDKSRTYMDELYSDSSNAYRLTGNLQLSF